MALNESFSDIFGSMTELRGSFPDFDWLIANEVDQNNDNPCFDFPFRNMADPMSLGHPDTYNSATWNSETKYHNKGEVQNYWFYLLSEGGSGVNELGFTYNLSPITVFKAEKIAYRALVYYLFPSAGFHDSRNATIQSAIDIYGDCSLEAQAVKDAWDAVGVYSNNNDIHIYNSKTWNMNTTISQNVIVHNGSLSKN